MWLICKTGFYSAVQKTGETGLTIRARVKRDLVNLIPYLPPNKKYEILKTPDSDYEYRLRCSHEDWAKALSYLGEDVDYDNFKSEIGKKDPDRERLLHSVWNTMANLGRKFTKTVRKTAQDFPAFLNTDWNQLDRMDSRVDGDWQPLSDHSKLLPRNYGHTVMETAAVAEPPVLSGYYRVGKL